MNYQKIYNNICERGKQRIKSDNVYMEWHHIIPKCLGGSDDDNNFTLLTPREHFICHYILAFKLYPNNYKLAHAIYSMSHQISVFQKRYMPGSRTYQLIREHAIILMKEHKKHNPSSGDKNGMYGKTHSISARNKISKANKGKTPRLGIKHTEESKRKISETRQRKIINGEIKTNKGYKPSSESIKKGVETRRMKYLNGELNGSMKGKQHSEETKEKWKINRRGKQVGSNNNNARPTKDIRTNIVYDCRKNCQADLNISSYFFKKLVKEGILINA